MRRLDIVADHLEREIGLHRRADVERAAVIERPAAMVGLDAAQIDADLALELEVRRLGEVMDEEHVFRRDRRVGFELEHPRAARPLTADQRRGRTAHAGLQRRHVVDLVHRAPLYANRAALWPERTAPSMVAGGPVSLQAPARTRLFQRVSPLGRFAACAGVAAKVARRSLTICQDGMAS